MVEVPAWIYREYDADYTREVPGEGYVGWLKTMVPINLKRTGLVVMHAWDCGTIEEYPGWYRAVEYIPRANEIVRTVFPPLLTGVRDAGIPVLHVVGGDSYVRDLPAYQRTVALAGPEPPRHSAPEPDASTLEIDRIRNQVGGSGLHNLPDIQAGFARVTFPEGAFPLPDEWIAKDEHQLAACCRHLGLNHLIYVGFAINWCLVMSRGSMLDMHRQGYLCSTIREATTAVENHESARTEANKREGLWRVALGFGLVFDLPDLLAALKG